MAHPFFKITVVDHSAARGEALSRGTGALPSRRAISIAAMQTVSQ
jgi:hypothetical protein